MSRVFFTDGEQSSLEKQCDDTKRMQTDQLLLELLYGSSDIDTALRRADALGMAITAGHYLVLSIELVASVEDYRVIQEACAHATDVLNGWAGAVFLCQSLDRILCVLQSADRAVLVEDADTCARAVRRAVESGGGCIVSVAIGAVVSQVGDLPKSLADANRTRLSLTLHRRKQLIGIQDIPSLIPVAKRLPTHDQLRYAAREDIPLLIDDYFSCYEHVANASFLCLNYIFMDVLLASSNIIEEYGGDPHTLLADCGCGILSERTEVRAMCVALLERAIDFRDSQPDTKYGELISRAQEYIKQNYSQQELSLHTVAQAVNLSPNHFSRIFSRETGETFIGYITKIRLEHAKTLLKTTQMRASDIGYAVGYSDTRYFSTVFKKNNGLTPKEYRKGKS